MPLSRAFTVCVEYHDLLSWTLNYNHEHFESVTVITTPDDIKTQKVVESIPNASCFLTNSFYEKGAPFAKYKCIEQALDDRGRYGWITLLDADILIPKVMPFWNHLREGYLYTPRRYICDPIPIVFPSENRWGEYKLHPQDSEWAGYMQVFHASDPVLGTTPWHDITWNNCSGADSFFQLKWKPHMKVRPTFRVLHLGPAFNNWCGRTTAFMDGSVPEEAEMRKKKLDELMNLRRVNRNFTAEKVE